MKIRKTSINLSHENVTWLFFHFYVFINNENLVRGAERYNVSVPSLQV